MGRANFSLHIVGLFRARLGCAGVRHSPRQ